MKYKVLRISAPIHADFKELVAKTPEYNLISATEQLILIALKRGEVEDSGQTAYKAVKSLEQIFKSWIRQHEKIYSSRLSEELLALIHELKNTATKKNLQELVDFLSPILELMTKEIQKTNSELKQELVDCKKIIQSQSTAINQLSEIVNDKLTKKGLF